MRIPLDCYDLFSCQSEEPFFSWGECHNADCKHDGHLGGDRYQILAREKISKEIDTLILCSGCMVDLCS